MSSPGASETVDSSCGHCGRSAQVPAEHAGRRGSCGGCGQVLEVPGVPPGSACAECGKRLRKFEEGRARCSACRSRPTPSRLLLSSLGFVVVGAPVAVLGYVFLKAMLEGPGIMRIMIVPVALGGLAALAGTIDLVRALIALASGQAEVRPLATKAVQNYVDDLGDPQR